MGPPRKVAYNMRMPPGMPARMALVCVLASAGVGHADPDRVERRRVAVIVLSESGDSGTKELAQRYYNTLLAHWALQPLGLPALDAALQNPLEDENKPNLDRARADKAAADDALVQLEYKKAEEAALDGEVALTSVTPSADVIALHAELALAQGRAELFLNNPNGASLAFGLTHRLDPGKQLDPKNYDPDVLSAYDRAKATTRAKLKVPITGSGRIWLDGVDVAEAPATIEIEIGQHVVQLTGLERITRGKSVVIEQGAHIEIADDPASDVRVAERVRLVLVRAVDPAARASAMKQLADLVHVHDAVLISTKVDGGLQVQPWRDIAPGFFKLRDGADKPIEVLTALAPAAPPEPEHVAIEPPIPFKPVIVAEPAWYQRRWVQASAVTTVVAALVGVIVWARRDQPMTWDPSIASAPSR